MAVLLDSQAVIAARRGTLPARARAVLADDRTGQLVSIASIWEMAIKRGLGKLIIEPDLASRLVAEGVDLLAITARHAEHVAELPDLHRDPFDRLLVAQALLEDLTVVTGNPVFASYGVKTIW